MLKSLINIIISVLVFLFVSQMSCAKSAEPLKLKNEVSKLKNKPSWLVIKDTYFYDADSDDLVTAGLGFSKLSDIKIANHFADNLHPTFHELRKAKLNRYINMNNGEGYYFGFKYNKLTPLFDGKIAGTEVQAYLDNGVEKVAFLLQIPLDFDKKNACIVAVPTMDAEGVYNAKDIQIRGLWGLNHNCAIVYNDKGLGNALFDLSNKAGYLINGHATKQAKAGRELLFFVDEQLPSNLITNRYATKYLHSKQNYEEKWGEYVIKSIEFAFYYLNNVYVSGGETIIDKTNTYVLVYGASDGGGAALKAGEYDTNGMIDGIVAVNPQIQISPNYSKNLSIRKGDLTTTLLTKSLIDYTSYGALYMPCAILALPKENTPYLDKYFFAQNRCRALKEVALLNAISVTDQAREALDKLYQYGWTKEMMLQIPFHYFTQSINLPYQYISAYGRYGVDEHLCHYSVASINQDILLNDGQVSPLTQTNFALLWSLNSGSLPIIMDNNIIAVDLVNDDDPNHAHRELFSRSIESTEIDYNLAGAICLRDMIQETRVQEGQKNVFASGKLNHIKTIIVHGQLNVKNLPDYSSRAYVALNSYQEATASQLRYIEVEHASYIDSDSPFDNSLIPIDFYGENAMNLLWNNITQNVPLPQSQVIRTRVRGGKPGLAPKIKQSNLIPISSSPNSKDRIYISTGSIVIPQ